MTIDKDIVLIQHILDAISAIEAFIINIDVVHFIESDLIASAVMKKFEIIGEASNKLSDDLKKEHADIPWSKIIGMRNILIHDYIGTDLEGVWNTIHQDLPELKAQLEKIDLKRLVS